MRNITRTHHVRYYIISWGANTISAIMSLKLHALDPCTWSKFQTMYGNSNGRCYVRSKLNSKSFLITKCIRWVDLSVRPYYRIHINGANMICLKRSANFFLIISHKCLSLLVHFVSVHCKKTDWKNVCSLFANTLSEFANILKFQTYFKAYSSEH